jgi:hypothetical protein
MQMNNYKLVVALALVLGLDTAGAVRVVEQVERAVELTLDQLTLPSQDGSTVSFRECDDCPVKTHVLQNTTVYTANRQVVGLTDLLRIAQEIESKNRAQQAMAVVFLDIATDRITRIEVRE